MSLFNALQEYQVEAISKMKLSLDHLWVIEKWLAGDKVEIKATKKLRELMWIKDDTLTQIAEDVYHGIINMKEPAEKKSKKSMPVTTQYDEQWSVFWRQWPAMRSFEWKGAKFTCKKPFKGSEQKMKQKYITTVQKGQLTAEQLNKAALVALSWCMENSYRKGKNEMEYHSGMEPWLNQEQYIHWVGMGMPENEQIRVTRNIDNAINM